MYRNPTFDYERDRANTEILIGDVRRFMRRGIIVVVAFASVLVTSGRFEAGINLMLMVGAPLIMIFGIGEALRKWSERRQPDDDETVLTIFDQLAQFDHEPEQGRHQR